jgi:hypothetical protein
MEMMEVLEVVQQFIQRDCETRLAFYTEPDNEAYQKTLAELERFYALEEGVHTGFGHRRKLTDQWQRMREKMGGRVAPRVLFQVKKYESPEARELFRVYLSGEFKHDQQGYGQIVSLEQTEAGLRIISIDGRCLSCMGRGKIGEEQCTACGGTGWEHGSGRKLKELGRLVEVCKHQAPTDPTSLADDESA